MSRLAEYKLSDPNYSNYPPFYAIDIPTVSNNKIPLALNCGGREHIDDAHGENPGKNDILFHRFTKTIITTAIEQSNLINNYYCYFLKVIKTAKNQPNFVCEITQNRRTSYCCGFIGCVIAYAMYYAETNPRLTTLNLDYVCSNGLEFYKKIAYTNGIHSWNKCANHSKFLYIYDGVTLKNAILNNKSIIILFSLAVVRKIESTSYCSVDTEHHFVVKVHFVDSLDDSYVTILDAWAGDGLRPLWIRIMKLTDFALVLNAIRTNYDSDHSDPNNLIVLNNIIETYFIPPHHRINLTPTFNRHVVCGGFDVSIIMSDPYLGFSGLSAMNGGYNKKTKIKSKKSKKNRNTTYLSSRKRRNKRAN